MTVPATGKARAISAISAGVVRELPLDPATGYLAISQGAPALDRTATGTLQAVNSEVSVSTQGASVLTVTWTNGAGFTGTIVCEGTNNGATWQVLTLEGIDTVTGDATSIAFPVATTARIVRVGGWQTVRVRASVGGGATTLAVAIEASAGDNHIWARSAEQYAPVAEDNTAGVIWTLGRAYGGATNAATSVDTAALAASGVIKASAGRLFEAFGFHQNGALRFFQLYNSVTVPGDGAVPVISWPVAANDGTFSISFRMGRYFATGIAWALSTTRATKTIAAADAWVNTEIG